MESNQEQQPVTAIPEQATPPNPVSPKHRNKLMYVIIFILTLLLLYAAFYIWSSRQIENIPQTTPTIKLPTVQINRPSIAQTISLPDFSKETVKPKTPIDTLSWIQFDDRQVGLRFKYPSEWGKPTVDFSDLTGAADSNGYSYTIRFPKGLIKVAGQSHDYELPVGVTEENFNGFYDEKLSNLIKPSDLCRIFNAIYCFSDTNKLNMITSTSTTCDMGTFEPFTRKLFIDRPDSKISGLVFIGSFLNSDLEKQVNACDIADTLGKGYDEPLQISKSSIESFAKAILNRRLDEASMRNLDMIEKVFETEESY